LIQTTSAAHVEIVTSLGFRKLDHLTVLRISGSTIRALRAPALPEPYGLRRAQGSDTSAVLHLDRSCFEPFWQLDAYGLKEAVLSTPRSRFRVVEDSQSIVGYCIVGTGAGLGYVQRLAIDPSKQRQGLARTLLTDGLHWVTRWRAHQVMVNTQSTNTSAIALYEALGFIRYGHGITLCASPPSL
jgi:ribosomal protein S18 acetylase RimI-like enzyme